MTKFDWQNPVWTDEQEKKLQEARAQARKEAIKNYGMCEVYPDEPCGAIGCCKD